MRGNPFLYNEVMDSPAEGHYEMAVGLVQRLPLRSAWIDHGRSISPRLLN